MERKVVRLSHVAKYHWLPGRGDEGRKEAKVVLRFLPKGDGSNGSAGTAETVGVVRGDKVSSEQADWEGVAAWSR